MERYKSNSDSSSFWKYPQQKTPPKNKDFEAIRQLKQAQSQLDIMKRRLSALKIKDEKNTRRSQTAIKKLKYHQFLQNIQQHQRVIKQQHRQQVQNKIQHQRNLNSSQRNERNHKLRQVRRMNQHLKHGAYLAEKRQSKELENKIKFINQSQMNSRRNLMLSIKEIEEQSRKNVQLYHWEKQNNIRHQRDNQKSRVKEMQESRALQIQEIARIELQMVSRNSKSRQHVQNTMGQLNSLVTQRRGQKGRSSRVQSTGNTTSNPEQH